MGSCVSYERNTFPAWFLSGILSDMVNIGRHAEEGAFLLLMVNCRRREVVNRTYRLPIDLRVVGMSASDREFAGLAV